MLIRVDVRYLEIKHASNINITGVPGKRLCAEFQGVTVAASIQTYGIYIPGKRPCGPKPRVMFKHPWALTRDTTV